MTFLRVIYSIPSETLVVFPFDVTLSNIKLICYETLENSKATMKVFTGMYHYWSTAIVGHVVMAINSPVKR